jgi:hypothetical protein
MADTSLSPGALVLLVRNRLYFFGRWIVLKARECHPPPSTPIYAGGLAESSNSPVFA